MSGGLKKSGGFRARRLDAGAAVAGFRGEKRRFRIGNEMRPGFGEMIFPRSRLRLDRQSGERDNKETADGSHHDGLGSRGEKAIVPRELRRYWRLNVKTEEPCLW